MQKIFSIRDAKAEFYNQPFFQRSHGEAERTFKSLVQDEKTMIGKFPSDYDLYFLGEFDSETGKSVMLDTPQHLVKGVDLTNAE